jgi:hypothetical protein
MGGWLDDIPNWAKPIPGTVLLGIALLMFLNGTIWFFGWGAGVVLTCAGLLMMKKKGDYNF